MRFLTYFILMFAVLWGTIISTVSIGYAVDAWLIKISMFVLEWGIHGLLFAAIIDVADRKGD